MMLKNITQDQSLSNCCYGSAMECNRGQFLSAAHTSEDMHTSKCENKCHGLGLKQALAGPLFHY
jgi:hypothetical protein